MRSIVFNLETTGFKGKLRVDYKDYVALQINNQDIFIANGRPFWKALLNKFKINKKPRK